MKKQIKRFIVYPLSIIIVLIIILYFIVTSSYFVKNILVPVTGKVIGTNLAVSKVSISPLRSFIEFEGVQMGSINSPFFKMNKFYCSFSLWELLKGNLNIEKLNIGGVDIQLEQFSNGSWNIPWLSLDETIKKEPLESIHSKLAKLPKLIRINLQVADLNISNVNVLIKLNSSVSEQNFVAKLENFSLTSKNIKNYSDSKIIYNGNIKSTYGKILELNDSELSGELDFVLNDYLIPDSVKLVNNIKIISGWINNNKLDDNAFEFLLYAENKSNEIELENLSFTHSYKEITISKLACKGNLFLNSLKGDFILSTNNIDLLNVNPFIPSNLKLNITEGILSSNFKLTTDLQPPTIKLVGKTSIKDLSLKSSLLSFNQFDIEQLIDINLKDLSLVEINNFIVNIRHKSKDVVKVSSKGQYDLSTNSGSIALNIPYFNITPLNEVLKIDLPLEIKSGSISSEMITHVDDNLNFSVNGTMKLNSLQYVFQNITYPKIDISTTVSSELNNLKLLNIKDLTTTILVDNKESILISSGGAVDLDNISDINVSGKLNLTNKTVLKLLPNYVGENKVSSFNIETAFNLKNDSAKDRSSVSLNSKIINFSLIPKKPSDPKTTITGYLNAEISKDSKYIALEKMECLINKDKSAMLNLKSVAKFHFNIKMGELPFKLFKDYPPLFYYPIIDLGGGKSSFHLSSEKICLKQFKDLYSELFTDTEKIVHEKVNTEKRSHEPSGKEPNSIDLHGLNLLSSIDLKGISYGSDINMEIKSKSILENNIINVKPFNVVVNQSPIDFDFYVNLGNSNGYPFELNGNFDKLNLAPLINIFNDGSFHDIKGEADDFRLNIKGKGITKKNLTKNLKGNTQISFKGLSLPGKFKNVEYIKILLLPLEIVSTIRQLLPIGVLPTGASKIIQNSKDIFSNKVNINLMTGNIKTVIENGKVEFKDFLFLGPPEGFVRRFSLDGYVTVDSNILFSTVSNIKGMIIPLTITGSLNKPSPAIPSFVANFVTYNTMNILNPMNVIDIGVGASVGLKNSAYGITNGAVDIGGKLLNPSSYNFNSKNPKEKTNSQKSIFNSNNKQNSIDSLKNSNQTTKIINTEKP